MTKKQNDIIIKGIVTPVVIAVFLTILITVSLSFDLNIPYKKNEAELAHFSVAEVKDHESFQGQVTDTISREEIGNIESNTLIGNVQIGDATYPLIYNASGAAAIGKLNITNNRIVGETGTSFMEIFKNEGAKVRLLNKGDIIALSTFYNEYEYEVTNTFVAKNDNQFNNAGSGTGSAIVIYTDNSTSIGISDEKFVAVCKLVSGTPVVE